MSRRSKELAAQLPPPAGMWRASSAEQAERLLPELAGTREGSAILAEMLQRSRAWALAYAEELGRVVGRGRVGVGPLALVRAAAYAKAWSERFYLAAAAYEAAGNEPGKQERATQLAFRLDDAARAHIKDAQAMAREQAGAIEASADALEAFMVEHGGSVQDAHVQDAPKSVQSASVQSADKSVQGAGSKTGEPDVLPK